jgi:hypothetical protein
MADRRGYFSVGLVERTVTTAARREKLAEEMKGK